MVVISISHGLWELSLDVLNRQKISVDTGKKILPVSISKQGMNSLEDFEFIFQKSS